MSGVRPGYGLLVGYASLQAVLASIMVALGRTPAGRSVGLLVASVGFAMLAAGIVRRRPEPRTAWWFIAAGLLLQVLTGGVLALLYGLEDIGRVSEPLPLVLPAISLPLLAVGLGLLGRRRVAGLADALDSAVLTLGGFLLLWTYFLGPRLVPDGPQLAVSVAYTIGVLLVFSTAVKLVMAGGLRDPTVRLVLFAVAVMLGTLVALLLPALRTSEVNLEPQLGQLWVLFSAVLGAAGAHPRLADRRRLAGGDIDRFPRSRAVMFVLVALVVPVALIGVTPAAHLSVGHSIAGVAATMSAAAALLLLLVFRLVLIARVAQRRAGELAAAVGEQGALQHQLAHRAAHDPLTGLANRAAFNERLEAVLAEPGPCALLLIDLDAFKDINDTLGHQVGDELLAQLGERLVGELPPAMLVARLGGDEFAMVLTGADADAARQYAAAVLEAVARPFVIAGSELSVTASVGVLITGPWRSRYTPSEALRDADLALYEAKASGKNRLVVFEPRLREQHMANTRLRSGLRQALARGEMELHYQPIVELDSGRVVGVEALLRWRQPDGALVASGAFVTVAEETGLIDPLGEFALRRACQDAKRWYDGYGVWVGVNIADRQLDGHHFVDVVLGALRAAGLSGEALALELTEASLVASRHDEARRNKLRELRSHGVRIVVDDFGAGFTKLSYVADLPVDTVKVEPVFTRLEGTPATASQAWALTRAVVQLIDSMDLKAIAEGVETPQQVRTVRALRLPVAQGYLLGHPVPAAEIDSRLRGAPVTVPSME